MHPRAEDALQLNGPSTVPLFPAACFSPNCAAVALVTCRKNNYQTPQNSMLLWPTHPVTFFSRLLSLTRPHHTDHIILFEQPAQKLFRFLFLPHAFCMPPSGLSCRLFVPPSCLFPHLSLPLSVRLSIYMLSVSLSVCVSHLFPFPQFTVFLLLFLIIFHVGFVFSCVFCVQKQEEEKRISWHI